MTINQNPNNYYTVNDNFVSKKKHKDMYISFEKFLDIDFLTEQLSLFCFENHRYSIIVRVCYSDSLSQNVTEWKSVGEQIGLHFEDTKMFNKIVYSFQETILNRIRNSMELYGKDEDNILFFQLLIFKVNYTDFVVKKKNLFNINSIASNKDLLNVSKTTKAFNSMLPLSMDYNNFGILLDKIISNNQLFIKLNDNRKINFFEFVNKYSNEKINNLSNDMLFYQDIKTNFIITIMPGASNIINVYSTEGMKIYTMIDTKLPNSNDFTRKIGNVLVYINEKGIYKKEIQLNLEPVYSNKISGPQTKMLHPDWMVGTMDIETFKDTDNLSKPYAVGFYTDKNLNTFYIDDNLDFDGVILNCINSMLVEKYNNFTFYIHNLGRFDIVFILKAIIKANTIHSDMYNYSLTFRDDLILSMEISSKIKGKNYKIKLVDSYNLLNSSLSKLCNTFNTETKKTYFPYDFINRTTLFFNGKKPSIQYFNNIDTITYKNITNEWSTKDETIKYLGNDLISLYSVIDKFKSQIYINYKTHITKSLTISGLAIQIFLKQFYMNNIPLINKASLYNDIKKSYFGGITEVYKPYGKDLYYYDVNSLYPYSALNVMPGLDCCFIDKIDKNINECLDNDFFGFYYCEIETSDNYIGLLPVRTETGLIMPLGKIKGWFFSEELKFAYENGYKIHVINGYKFSKSYNVFDKYVKEFYHIKSTTKDPVVKMMSKSLLNNLLGRFGLNIDKSITELVTEDKYEELLQSKKIKSVKFIEDKILVTYDTNISEDICDLHNVDYKETLFNDLKNGNRKNKMFRENNHHDVSIVISSAITSYSRIYMNKIKLDILSKGGFIYYTDTDSIVTDVKLDEKIVGTKLGQFKLEHEIDIAYFISTKTYGFKNKKGEIIIKAKGVNNLNLNLEDFKNMYLGKNIETTRNETIRDFSNGSVNINVPKNIILSGNVYNKRTKVYNKKNMWIDTKPIIHNRSYTTNIPNSKFILSENFLPCIISIITVLFLFLKASYFIYFGCLECDIDILNDISNNYQKITELNNDINIFDKYKFVELDKTFDRLHKIESSSVHSFKSDILEAVRQKHFEDNISNLEYYKSKCERLEYQLIELQEDYRTVYKVNNDALRLVSNIRNSV